MRVRALLLMAALGSLPLALAVSIMGYCHYCNRQQEIADHECDGIAHIIRRTALLGKAPWLVRALHGWNCLVPDQMGIEFEEWKMFNPVQYIQVHNDNDNGVYIKRVRGTPQLKHLYVYNDVIELHLSDSDFDDTMAAQLRHMRHVKLIDLERTPITDAGLVHMEKLPSVEDLLLPRDEQLSPEDEGYDLKYNRQITNRGLRSLGHMHSLQILWVGGIGITDEGLRHLSSLKHLEDLSLYNTSVTRRGILTLSQQLPEACISHEYEGHQFSARNGLVLVDD